ncbi:MAG: hypothetical protein ACJ763_17215 [Bdellovibrionia bacterium]
MRFSLRWALSLTALQILFMLALAPGTSFGARYLAFNNWDSFHYLHIAEGGYKIPTGTITSDDIHEGRANVVFFPGYPMAARGVSQLTGLSVPLSLLIVAQLCCFIFWIYFFLLMKQFGLSEETARNRALCIALHPAAFYLVAGYTETLFLVGMMGFLYWSNRWLKEGGVAGVIAAAHGFAMSITRIVSFAPASYPSFVELFSHGPSALKKAKFWKAVAISLAGVSGAVVFFAYCQSRFGMWNLYFQLEETGWQNHRRWFAVINPLSYVPRFFFEHSVDSLNRTAVLVTGIQLVQTFPKKQSWRKIFSAELLPLWIVAFTLFYIALTGKANANMDSMLRYTLPPFILLLLIGAREGTDLLKRPRWIALAAVFSFALQIWCAYRFLRGHWVA